MDASSLPDDFSSGLSGLMNGQDTNEQQQAYSDVVANRAFHSDGMKEFLENLKEMDQSAILKDEEAKEAAEKAQGKKDMKNATVRFVKNMFTRSSNKSEKKGSPDVLQPSLLSDTFEEKAPDDMRPEERENNDTFHPSPYVQPLKYQLHPRHEQANLTPSNMNALISTSTNPDAPVSAITIARHRGEAALALFGPSSSSANNSAVTSLRENSHQTKSDRNWTTSDIESIDIDQPLDYNREEMSFSPSYERDDPEYGTQQQEFQYQQYDLEDVIVQLSQDPSCRAAWKQYMESYAHGHFNLNNPPPPPPLSSSFEYLPSVFPPGEADRMKLSRQYDVLWPKWSQEKAGKLIRDVTARFGTKLASISFFDEESEVFKVEIGYDQPRVGRDISFAAHCVLSKDVFVIPDTKEDWRFTKNPLATTKPKIRFWAGAPMMSECGEVLGVLAVFSTNPRASFTAEKRRELSDYTSIVMADFKSQVDELSRLQRSTSILDRDSVINAPYRAQSIKSVIGLNEIDTDLVPCALTYHKVKTPKIQQSRLFVDRTSQEALIQSSEQTPPASADSSFGYFESPTSLMNRHDSGSGRFGMTQAQPSHESMALYPSDFRVSSPRPFSSSDLTSLHPHPPNTPVNSVRETDSSNGPKFELDWNDFKDLTDEDCAEPILPSHTTSSRAVRRLQSGRFTGASNNKKRSSHLESISSMADDQEELDLSSDRGDCHSDRNEDGDLPGRGPSQMSRALAYRSKQRQAAGMSSSKVSDVSSIQVSSPRTINRPRIDSSPLIDLSTPPDKEETNQQSELRMTTFKTFPSRGLHRMPSTSTAFTVESAWSLSEESMEEAAYACALHAQNLGYDLVYAVEIKPRRQFMSDNELLGPNGLHKKLLVAYGLSKTIALASDTHIRVLRGRGGEHWQDKMADKEYNEGEYQTGLLIPILSEGGPRKSRSTGVILGAFRKARSVASDFQSPAADMERLVEFGEELKNIILRKERKQHRSNMEAQSTSAFPANEARAVELKSNSLDVSRRRPY